VAISIFVCANSALCATSVTKNGITWTFDTDYTVGQFANGDFYVVDPGSGVTITSISNTHHSGTDLSSVDYDGTTLNVNAWSFSDQNPNQGWDSRMRGYDSTYNINRQLPHTLTHGNCLTTVESWLPSDDGAPYHNSGRLRPTLKVFAILTCMSSDVGSTAFRPSYGTGQKTIYYTTDLQTQYIPDLSETPNTPDLSTVENYVSHPWVDLIYEWSSEYWRPSENFGVTNASDSCTFQPNIVNKYSEAILRLCINSGDRTDLLIYLVQIGIDYYGLLKNGASWPSNGAQNIGYKLPILFAGMMLNDSNMLAVGNMDIDAPNSNSRAQFHEDGSTFYISQAEVDATNSANWNCDERGGCEAYESGDIGTAEWGIRHSEDLYRDSAAMDAIYRSIFSNPMIGQVLAAKIFDLQDIWNHDALFDYIDRWESVRTDYTYANRFVSEMWSTYEPNTPYIEYNPDNLPFSPSAPAGLRIISP
jgi:hypothetical protein